MTVNPNLPVSRLINVAVSLSPAGASFPNLSTMLALGTSTVIDVVTRMRTYATLAAVAADFGTSVAEYTMASAWFGQSPQPTSLNIGRWAKTASAGQLYCGALSAANTLVSAWTGITTGAVKIAVDGGSVTLVDTMNFSAVTTLNGVAGVVQTALQAIGGAFSAVTCTYDVVYNRFIITSGTTGTTSAISFLTAPGADTDITAMMAGLAASAGAYVANGIAAETALAAVTLFDSQFSGQWYGLDAYNFADTDITAVASYIEGATTPHFFFASTNETQLLATGDTTHIGYLLQQLSVTHTSLSYSSTNAIGLAASSAARILTTNWSGQNTAISLMYKTMPGIAPENFTLTQANALESYNANAYLNYANGAAIYETGITPSGQFIDTVIGIDWLRGAIQTNVFNVLYTSTTKISQTDQGMTSISSGIEAACSQGVINGLLAPGVWNSGGFGQLTIGQWMDKGYYIYQPPIASQLQPIGARDNLFHFRLPPNSPAQSIPFLSWSMSINRRLPSARIVSRTLPNPFGSGRFDQPRRRRRCR